MYCSVFTLSRRRSFFKFYFRKFHQRDVLFCLPFIPTAVSSPYPRDAIRGRCVIFSPPCCSLPPASRVVLRSLRRNWRDVSCFLPFVVPFIPQAVPSYGPCNAAGEMCHCFSSMLFCVSFVPAVPSYFLSLHFTKNETTQIIITYLFKYLVVVQNVRTYEHAKER